jgi:hypothetical protein
MIIEYSLGLNAKLKIIGEGSAVYTLVNINDLVTCINDIISNTWKYDGNLFDGMTIEIFQKDYNDVNYPSPFINNNYVGLASAFKKLIQFRHDSLNTLSNMSACFSHEFGHYKAYFSDWDNKNNLMRQLWEKIRGGDVTTKIPAGELIAEDLRMYQGSRLTKDVWRTDPTIPHKKPDQVKGLRTFYAVYKPANELIKNLSAIGRISELSLLNSNVDYFEIRFRFDFNLPFFGFAYYKVDLTGIYKYEWNGWQLQRGF